MENTIQLFKQFFNENEWEYSYDEEKNVFVTGVNMNNALGNIHIIIRMRQTSYTVYAILNSNAEETNISLVAEYLHRANYGLLNGNFELDYEDGEVRYKTHVNFEDTTVSEEILNDSILLPIFMFEKYGMNLLKIMLGDNSPQKLIEEIENNNKNE